MGGGDAPSIDETEEERELAEIGKERLDRYFQVFKPIEDEYMSMVRQKESDRDQLRGKIVGQVGNAFDNAKAKKRAEMFAGGVNPSSSRYRKAMAKITRKYGESRGFRATDADQASENMQIAGLQKIVDMGRGKANDSIISYQDIAGDAYRQAAKDADMAIESRMSDVDTAFGLAGLGVGVYSNTGKDKK